MVRYLDTSIVIQETGRNVEQLQRGVVVGGQ